MRRGFLIIETIVSAFLIALVLIAYTTITVSLVRTHDQTVLEHRLLGAAELAMHSARAGVDDPVALLAEVDPDLMEMISLEIVAQGGEGDWLAARKVTAVAKTRPGTARRAQASLTTMIFDSEAGP